MVNIIKKELEIDESIKSRIDFICKFTNTKAKYINGYLRQVDLTNLVYCEPHRVIINDITYLFFNNSDEIYIDNLNHKLLLKELESHIKTHKSAIK